MIVTFEHDTRDHGHGRFAWYPELFRATWAGRPMWKFGWGFWSLTYYPAPGLREFFKHVEAGNTTWHERSTR